MAEVGMTGAELRMVFGKNIMDLTDEELDRAIAIVRGRGPGDHLDRLAAAEVRAAGCAGCGCAISAGHVRGQAYIRGPAAARRRARSRSRSGPARGSSACSPIGGRCGRRSASTGSWRRSRELADQAARHGVTIGLENEHACNIATAAETAQRAGGAGSSESEGGVGSRPTRWSPGEKPFPEGYWHAAG